MNDVAFTDLRLVRREKNLYSVLVLASFDHVSTVMRYSV